MILDSQNNALEIEIKAKSDSVSALQKSLKEMNIKQQKVLVQPKQELSEKDMEFFVLLNNLNTMNNKKVC